MVALLALALGSTGVRGASPVINRVIPPGLTLGQSTTLTIEGTGLDEARVLLPVPVVQQQVLEGSSSTQLRISVEVDSQVIPDLVPLAVVNERGVSAPRVVSIDALPQVPRETSPVDLPAAVYGELSGRESIQVQFTAKAKGPVWIEVEAQRIGSPLRPDLRVLDESGRQLGWSGPQSRLDGDARLQADLPGPGVYQVQLRDVAYEARDRAPFRLKIGHRPAAEVTDPIAVTAGESTSVVMRGMGPEGATRSLLLVAQAAPGRRWLPIRDPAEGPVSGPAPRVLVSPWPEPSEQALGDKSLVPPAAVNGALLAPGEVDRWSIQAAAGQRLVAAITARQAGSELDGRLEVFDAQGKKLGQSDDRADSLDPRLEFEVPAESEGLELRVSDTQGKGSAAHVYRLAVWPEGLLPETVTLDESRIEVPAGARVVLPVRRAASDRSLEIIAAGLPPGIQLEGERLPAQRAGALLTLSASHSAPPGSAAFVRWMAERTELLAPVAPDQDLRRGRRELAEVYGIPVAVTGPAPMSVRWGDSEDPVPLVRGRSAALPLELEVAPGGSGKIRLQLLAASRPVRSDAPQPGENRPPSLRVVDAPLLEHRTQSVQLTVETPAELEGGDDQFAVVAELLGDDESVIARASTGVVERSIVAPLEVAVDAVVPMDGERQYLVEGHVRRAPGVGGGIELTVEGLDEQSPVPSVRLPESADAFRLVVTAPATGSAKLRARGDESGGSGASAEGSAPGDRLEAEATVTFPAAP